MVKKQHKIICLFLCLALAVTAICAGTVGAFAASGDTVYVRLNNGWTKPYCYMWTDGLGDNNAWPGIEMTKVDDNVYAYTLTGDYKNIIFNDNGGNGDKQTGDMSYPGNGYLYDLSLKKWESYVSMPTTPQPTSPTTTPQPTTAPSTTPSGSGVTVYLKNEAGWSTPYCYMWNSGTDSNKAWPGEAMTSIGGDVYQYTAAKAYVNCIFNGGSDANKTGDLTTKNGYIYNNKTNSWSVYDVNDLQVVSFSAEPDSGVYTGTEVTLSALARNTKISADVFYKFSVTNAQGGTSVVSAFSSANSVIWTPSTAGTYTINFDFMDSAGNTNNRTATVTVEDDTTLVKPIIKGVTPANLNLIKVNSSAVVSVKAGGGKTGTNLLFYKYVVTDPNGVQNIPYYTLNNTYTFTPTMTGTYTVNVYVQASDNSTVNKTYTYTATNSDVPTPTNPVTPTSTSPVIPTTAPITTTAPVVTTSPVTTTVPVVTTVPPTTPPTTPTKLRGDADGDGKISIMDATYIQKAIVELPDVPALSELDMDVCDVDGDGFITIKDATAIQLIIVKG